MKHENIANESESEPGGNMEESGHEYFDERIRSS